jgi:hypothetical protein
MFLCDSLSPKIIEFRENKNNFCNTDKKLTAIKTAAYF